MVKTPRTRHAKPPREPLTIDLTPADVDRDANDEPPTVFNAAESETVESPSQSRSEPFEEPASVSSEPFASASAEPELEPADAKPVAETIEPARETRADREALADSDADDNGYGFARTDRPAQPAAEPPVVAPRRGLSSALAAGVAGGIVALLIALLVQFTGLLGTGSGDATVSADIESLRQEVEALRNAGAGGDVAGRVDGLSAAVDAVKSDLAGFKEAVAAAGGSGNATQALDDRLKQLETLVAGLSPSDNGANAADLTALGERIAGMEALVKSASDAATGADSRIATLEQSVTALAGRVDAQAQQPRIALAIATAGLKAAIDRGAPFLAEFETFAAIAPDAAELAALKPFAEKGVASREALLAESDQSATAMLAAASPVDPDAGFLDRLLHSAGGLVTVRPIGDVQGAGVPEIVARMQVAIRAGDLQKALSEYETLPDPSKAAGAPFADRLKARLSAESLVDQAIAAAMKA